MTIWTVSFQYVLNGVAEVIARVVKIAILFIAFIAIVGISTYLTLTFIIKSEDTIVVPDLAGKDIVYVLEILSDLGLNTKIKRSEYSSDIPADHIIFQEPGPGAEIKKGRDVRIIISKGARTILTPNLKGLSVRQARIILEENDLRQGILSSTYSKDIKKEVIITQTPSSGAMIKREESVDLLVSIGVQPKAYKMPDLEGLFLDDAILLIERSDLLLGEIKSSFHKDKPKNVIIIQKPLSGHRTIEGTQVNITINREPGEKGLKYLRGAKRVSLFSYRLKEGFLKRHIRVQLNSFGFSIDLFDDFVNPGKEIRLLIPNNNSTVFLYEDNKLIGNVDEITSTALRAVRLGTWTK